jgi:hypothetical protein
MGIQVKIASDAHVFDAYQPRRVIEMVQHVFEGDRIFGADKPPHGGDSQNAAAARGGSNHLIGLATRDARRQRATV